MKKNLLLILCFPVVSVFSQISEGGMPYSFTEDGHFLINYPYEIFELTAPDIEAVILEDELSDQKGKPYRVGINIPFPYQSGGSWETLPNGDRIWRLGIHIPDALALSLYFSSPVQIPEGGKLYVYNERRSQYVGAYTSRTPDFYAMEMIQGDFITLEYYMPSDSYELPELEISEVAYYYRGVGETIASFADGLSYDRVHGSCEVDAMCEEADGWEDQRDAAVRYTFVAGGTFLCSGTVINNTANDCTPYILTANHCGEPDATSDINNHVWYFNYQRPNCTPGNTSKYSGAQSQTMSGGFFRASSSLGTHPAGSAAEMDGCDFALIELEEPIPTFYDAYFAGWNRNATPVATSGVCFHHPAGDEKKISTYSTNLVSNTYNGGWAQAHWRVTWASTTNGHGVTEGGSSGSSLYDQEGYVVGHLSGGSSFCSAPTDPDLYGKFLKAWDQDGTTNSSKLAPWLDADGIGNTKQAGFNGIGCAIVGLDKIEAPKISVYPNPTSSIINIDLSGFSGEEIIIQITDVSGKICFYYIGIADNTLEVDLSVFENGVYLVNATTSTGNYISKVVKK
ncbi:MAG: T9SS type A sorting domain-containing protein [Crocinitomicaceae bacterium]|nr:T9SS type A sorting domain-containing protein [Crocinitomicaceae bacterium]